MPRAGEPISAIAAACFWVAIKFVAVRTSMPNASFLGHVTGERTADLFKELDHVHSS